eukprot:2550140-Pleurochrysis_carterae.AAC.1
MYTCASLQGRSETGKSSERHCTSGKHGMGYGGEDPHFLQYVSTARSRPNTEGVSSQQHLRSLAMSTSTRPAMPARRERSWTSSQNRCRVLTRLAMRLERGRRLAGRAKGRGGRREERAAAERKCACMCEYMRALETVCTSEGASNW